MTDDARAKFGGGRLSEERVRHLQERAVRFRQLVNWVARKQVEDHQFESLNGAMFAICAELIQRKTDRFCEKAEDEFDTIEAYGSEPELDDDWLDELTGEKDSFYFSTDSIEKGLPPLPRRARGKKPEADLDEGQMAEVVEKAVQSFEQAMAVSHGEQPQEWIEKIKGAISDKGGEAEFWGLQTSTGLSPGALFLGLLLGHENWTPTQLDFQDIPSFYGSFSVRLIEGDGDDDGQEKEDGKGEGDR
ncbi:MAG: hypothetical protein WA885_05400 [Phormidesmis sp.]